jgi:predicted nucleotidyltransferase
MKNNKNLKRQIIPILKQYDVLKAAIFGSVARGEERKNSDLDLLIKFGGQKSLLDLAGLKIALEKTLKRKVDVLTYGSIHPLLRKRILKEQKVIYG